MLKVEAEITDPSRPLLRWRVTFAGPPLPSGLPQAFLSMRRRAWDELDDDRRERLLAATASHSARTRRPLIWGEHTAICGRERDTFVSVGPVSQGGELHREVAAALPRSVPLIAYDPIAGAPCEARPPRPTRPRPGAPEAAPSPEGRRVVAFRGTLDEDRAVAQLDAVVVDSQGRDVDDGGDVAVDGDLPFEGSRIGPFDHANGRVVVAFRPPDARAALGAIISNRVKGFAGVSQCLFAVLRSLESGAPDFEGWAVSRLASPADALAWYASPEQAASLAQAAAAAASQEFWACVFKKDAPALAAASRALLRAAAAPRETYEALAGLEVSGTSAAEVAAELDRRAPDGDPAVRARLYGDALRRVRASFKRGWF